MLQFRKIFFGLFIGLSLFAFKAEETNKILLKSGTIVTQEIDSKTKISELASSYSENNYSIIVFNSIPTEAEKNTLLANGINLLDYLPNSAFLAFFNQPSQAEISSLNISSALPFSNEFKHSSYFLNAPIPDWVLQGNNQIDLMINKQTNANTIELLSSLENIGASILSIDPSDELFIIRLDLNNVNSLLDIPAVKYVEYAPPAPEKEDREGRSLHRGNMLDSDHALGRRYDGTGVSIAIADDGAIGPHIDIQGRVTQFVTVDNGTHGDMTTGIAMGAGNLNPRMKGMATGAYLYYYDIGGYPHITNAITNFTNRGVVVTSTSYSEGCNDGYTSGTSIIDQQIRAYPSILHVFSAGNSSASSCGANAYGAGTPWGTITGGRKQGKNVIAVGNLDYLGNLVGSSSRGPAADGRIKPDICSNGGSQMSTASNNNYQVGGGTSAASPGVAGLSAQLYHGYRDLHNGANPEAALIKSAMLNTARDIGNPGPDFFYGWGRVNAHRAMKLIEESRYQKNTITQGVSQTRVINIPNALDQLKLMVYWTDFEGSSVSSKSLVNDLDMLVIKPNGDTLYPWVLNHAANASILSQNAVRGVDNRNNVEQVTIDAATAGNYTVVVNGNLVPQGPQDYYITWETLSDEIELTFPYGGEGFVPGETETIRWDAHSNSGSFLIEYSTNGGTTWNTIGTSSGTQRYRNWNVPSSITSNALVRVSRNSISSQSAYPFTIVPHPNNFTVQYTCVDSVKLRWNAIPGVSEYEIYQMGTTYMDSIGRTSGNDFTLYNLTLSNDNWVSIAPILNGSKGRRRDAILLPKTTLNCPLAYDINIAQMSSPTGASIPSCGQDKIHIQVTINNAGDSVLRNVPIRCVSGTTTLFDTIPGPIPSRSFQFFTFSDSLLLVPGPTTVSVIADLPNDMNYLNDSVGVSFNVIGSSIYTLPYSDNFDSFGNCSTNSDCGTTNCNLGGGWSNLANGVDDIFDMRTNSGATPSSGTGPSADHNTGSNGKYIYAEASNGCLGVESRVLSPCIDLTGAVNPQLSFWYHMYGTNMGIIRLDILADGVWTSNIITPLYGNLGNNWLQQTVNLSNYTGKIVALRFRFTTGNDFTSDMAIDDISITDQSVGIQENGKNAFSIFPNPSQGIFNLKFENSENKLIRVLDLNGRVVKSIRVNTENAQLNLSELSKGIYFLDIDGFARREKIILL